MQDSIQEQLPFEDQQQENRIIETIRRMPKADLHRHLTGSVRPDSLLGIAQEYNITLPYSRGEYDIDFVRRHTQFNGVTAGNLDRFIKRVWRQLNRIVVDRNIVERLVVEAAEDAFKDNVTYLELRMGTYGLLRQSTGQAPVLTLEDALLGFKNGIDKARMGLPGMVIKGVISVPRHRVGPLIVLKANSWVSRLLTAVDPYKGEYIVGFDLSGFENKYSPALFQPFFLEAKSLGYGVTVHAGESTGPRSIWEAAKFADRIGHAVSAVEDERLVAELKSRNITIEVCPTSNIVTGVVNSYNEHPVNRFVDAGIRVALCTDDPQVCGVTLSDEYFFLFKNCGLSIEQIQRMNAHAFKSQFSQFS